MLGATAVTWPERKQGEEAEGTETETQAPESATVLMGLAFSPNSLLRTQVGKSICVDALAKLPAKAGSADLPRAGVGNSNRYSQLHRFDSLRTMTGASKIEVQELQCPVLIVLRGLLEERGCRLGYARHCSGKVWLGLDPNLHGLSFKVREEIQGWSSQMMAPTEKRPQ